VYTARTYKKKISKPEKSVNLRKYSSTSSRSKMLKQREFIV